MQVKRLYEGDKFCETLLDAILATIYERGEGLPIPSIIGVLELAKNSIIEKALENED